MSFGDQSLEVQFDSACWVFDLRVTSRHWETGAESVRVGPSGYGEAYPGTVCGSVNEVWKGSPPSSVCVTVEGLPRWDEGSALFVLECGATPRGVVVPDALSDPARLGHLREQALRPAADWFRQGPADPTCPSVGMPPPAEVPRGPVDRGGCRCAYDAPPRWIARDLATHVAVVAFPRRDSHRGTLRAEVQTRMKGELPATLVLNDPYAGTACGFVPGDGAADRSEAYLGPANPDGSFDVSACTLHTLEWRGRVLSTEGLKLQYTAEGPCHRAADYDRSRCWESEFTRSWEPWDPPPSSGVLFEHRCLRSVGIPAHPALYRPMPVEAPAQPEP